jgi:hypothetical protein
MNTPYASPSVCYHTKRLQLRRLDKRVSKVVESLEAAPASAYAAWLAIEVEAESVRRDRLKKERLFRILGDRGGSTRFRIRSSSFLAGRTFLGSSDPVLP